MEPNQTQEIDIHIDWLQTI